MPTAAWSRSARLADWASLQAYRLGWAGVRWLPGPAAYRLFQLLADVAFRRDGTSVRRMRENYRRVRPDLDAAALDELTRRGMRSYLRYWCEAFRLPDLGPEYLARRVRAVGDAPVREALAQGRGVVCFLSHLGNWDMAGAWATHHLAPVTTVAERLKPEELFDQFVSYRERLGMTILPLTGTDPPFRQLVRGVREGAFVPLLADRDLTESGLFVRFCDESARMAAGPAALALATGAPLHPVAIYYEADPGAAPGPSAYRLVVEFGPAVHPSDPGASRAEQTQDLTQQCADFLTGQVRAHTEDWHMIQQVFVPAPGHRETVA